MTNSLLVFLAPPQGWFLLANLVDEIDRLRQTSRDGATSAPTGSIDQ